MSETVVIIRPSFKKICGDNDACRAAVFNQMLYNIAWKLKQGVECWYGTAEEICESIDHCWSVHKVRNEIDKLAEVGLLGRNHKKSYDRTYLYSFGNAQAQTLQRACKKIGISLHHLGLPADVLSLLKRVGAVPETCDCPVCQPQNETTPHLSNMGNGSAISGKSKEQKREMQTPDQGNAFAKNGGSLPKGTAKESSKDTTKGQAKEGETPSLPKQQPITEPLPALPPSSSLSEKEMTWETITPQTPHCLEAVMAIATHYLGAAKVTQADADAFIAKTQSLATLTGPHEVRKQLIRNLTFLLSCDAPSNWFSKGDRRKQLTFSKAVAWHDDTTRKANAADWTPPLDKLPGWYHLDEIPSQQQAGGMEGEDYLSGMDEQEAQTLTARILADFPGMKITWGNLPHGRCTVGLDMGEGYWLDMYKPWEWGARGEDSRFAYVLEAYEQQQLVA